MEGWVKAYRSLQEHWVWQEKPFSKGQAWIDLMLLANHSEKKAMRNGEVFVIKRGQRLTSIKGLADRWGWSRKKVSGFLDRLELDRMLEQERTTKDTLVTLVNYDFFQSEDTAKEHQKNIKGTSEEHQKNTNKNERMKECKKETYSASDEADSFAEQCAMIRDLYNSVCGSYPRLVKLSEKRKKAIRARMNSGYSVLDFKMLFEKAEQSRFLKGGNDRNWTADFDWLITDKYMPRVLEGKYDDALQQQKSKASNKFNNFQGRSYDMDSLERQLQGK